MKAELRSISHSQDLPVRIFDLMNDFADFADSELTTEYTSALARDLGFPLCRDMVHQRS